MLKRISLRDDDRTAVRTLLSDIANDPANLEESVFLSRAPILAHELPRSVREIFYEFKLQETTVGLLLSNNPIYSGDIGRTPATHWRRGENRPLNIAQIMHGLYSCLLGEPFGFETQQAGRIFNDLIPIRGVQPNSSSGDGKVGLHTEDCSQPFMPDYLGFLCLRNDERAVTTFSSLWDVEIPEDHRNILFTELVDSCPSRCTIARLLNKWSVLFGDTHRPYLRYGFVDTTACSAQLRLALKFVSDSLERNRETVILGQGDCLYLDNFFAVHGRALYSPLYGPSGRWLCRIVMARDLRKTRAFRAAPGGRVMLQDTY